MLETPLEFEHPMRYRDVTKDAAKDLFRNNKHSLSGYSFRALSVKNTEQSIPGVGKRAILHSVGVLGCYKKLPCMHEAPEPITTTPVKRFMIAR